MLFHPSPFWTMTMEAIKDILQKILLLKNFYVLVIPLYILGKKGRSEVEFLIEKSGKPIPIEVKSGWITKAQSLSKFRKKYTPPKSVILSAKEPKIGERGYFRSHFI